MIAMGGTRTVSFCERDGRMYVRAFLYVLIKNFWLKMNEPEDSVWESLD